MPPEYSTVTCTWGVYLDNVLQFRRSYRVTSARLRSITTLGLTLDYNTRDILSLSQTLAPVSLSTLHRRNNGSQDGTKPTYA